MKMTINDYKKEILALNKKIDDFIEVEAKIKSDLTQSIKIVESQKDLINRLQSDVIKLKDQNAVTRDECRIKIESNTQNCNNSLLNANTKIFEANKTIDILRGTLTDLVTKLAKKSDDNIF